MSWFFLPPRKQGTTNQRTEQCKRASVVWNAAALWLASLEGKAKREYFWKSPATMPSADELASVSWHSREMLPNGLLLVQKIRQIGSCESAHQGVPPKNLPVKKGGPPSIQSCFSSSSWFCFLKVCVLNDNSCVKPLIASAYDGILATIWTNLSLIIRV